MNEITDCRVVQANLPSAAVSGPFPRENNAYSVINTFKFIALIDGKEYSLFLTCRIGKIGHPLVVAFPGYLSNPDGVPIFYGANQFVLPTSNHTLITINDREGVGRDGSWYLGQLLDNGLYSYQILIKLAINHFQKLLRPSKTIFFGSSMGGFGALIHSTTCAVDESYISVPQSSLNPSYHYWRRHATDYSKERVPFTVSSKLESLFIETQQKFEDSLEKNPFLDIARLSEFIRNKECRDWSPLFKEIKFANYYHIVATRYDNRRDISGTYSSR